MAQTPGVQRRVAQQQAAARRLTETLLDHLWTEFPQHCVTLTERPARACVEAIIRRGALHGFVDHRCLCGYANLMVFLGADFDEDEQVQWAAEVLATHKGATRPAAMGALLARCADELSAVAGDEGQHYRRALVWVRSKAFAELSTKYAAAGLAGAHRFLAALYASKYAHLGTDAVGRLFQDATARATRYGLTSPEGHLVYLGLMVLLGRSFADDPFHPWAAAALEHIEEDVRDGRITPVVAAQTLHRVALAQLERFLKLDRVMRGS